jgi:hypothetical protein
MCGVCKIRSVPILGHHVQLIVGLLLDLRRRRHPLRSLPAAPFGDQARGGDHKGGSSPSGEGRAPRGRNR